MSSLALHEKLMCYSSSVQLQSSSLHFSPLVEELYFAAWEGQVFLLLHLPTTYLRIIPPAQNGVAFIQCVVTTSLSLCFMWTTPHFSWSCIILCCMESSCALLHFSILLFQWFSLHGIILLAFLFFVKKKNIILFSRDSDCT